MSASLIDNIYTNNICACITPGILYCDATDHFPIFQVTSSHRIVPSSESVIYRKINNDTLTALKTDLVNTDWRNVVLNNNANDAYNIFFK